MNVTRSQLLRYSKAQAQARKPFFLAYGAHRPHLPWNFPRRFWDAYPPTEQIALPTHEAECKCPQLHLAPLRVRPRLGCTSAGTDSRARRRRGRRR